jgi:hypothetical protein
MICSSRCSTMFAFWQAGSKHIVPITASFILTTFLDTASAYRVFVRYDFLFFECIPLDSSKSEDMCSEYYVFLTCEFRFILVMLLIA